MDWFFPDILWYNGANIAKHHLIFFSWLNISFYFSYNYSYVFPLWSIFDSLLCLLIVGNYNFLPVEIAYYLSHQYVLGNYLLLNNYLNMDFSFSLIFSLLFSLLDHIEPIGLVSSFCCLLLMYTVYAIVNIKSSPTIPLYIKNKFIYCLISHFLFAPLYLVQA